jgi:CIC family chloride channel protein
MIPEKRRTRVERGCPCGGRTKQEQNGDEGKMAKNKAFGPLSFYLLSVLVGVVAGLGAVAFRDLIALFHNLLFLGKLSVFYDANIHPPPSPWGPFVVLVPVVGALGVTFLVQKFAPEAKGHGVPEVMDGIYYNKGIIRPVVALIKSIASALSIGTGGSVGREGPIVQIGSSFGSTIGQLIHMPVWQRITLIGAGTGGGIAATFNTPIGGVLFALELMLHEVSVRTIVPVAISTVTATYIGQVFFGSRPSFVIPSFEIPYFHLDNPILLLSYACLGGILGLACTVYIKSIYVFEDFFNGWIKRNPYLRHIAGMFLVGVIIYLLMTTLGHYYIEGVGYAAIQDILSGSLQKADLLLLLFLLKLLATSLTLGSGASGGIFSPSLYLGATVGGAYGIAVRQFWPWMAVEPAAFAVAGMAGVVGGATGAPMAAIVMIFEMTLDYNVIIPMTITVAISYAVRKLLCRESIYTMKLTRRGHRVPEALQASTHELKRAGDIMDTLLMALPASTTLGEYAQIVSKHSTLSTFLIEDRHKRIIGVVSRDVALRPSDQTNPATTLGDIKSDDFVSVTEETALSEILEKMRSSNTSIVLVTDGKSVVSTDSVKGLITKQQVGGAMMDGLDLFLD